MKAKRTAAEAKTRVFLVDDHPIVRRGFQLLLSLERDMMVCGEADSAPQAMKLIAAAQPDIVVVDLALKAGSGLELIKQLRIQYPKLKMLVFSMRAEALYAERALRAGANGYITKEEGTDKAIEAIRVLLRGQRYLSEAVTQKLMERVAGGGDMQGAKVDVLTDRELEVLELLGQGLASRHIAARLHVSLKTIESHREHIKQKLGLGGAAELIRYAFDWVQSSESGRRR